MRATRGVWVAFVLAACTGANERAPRDTPVVTPAPASAETPPSDTPVVTAPGSAATPPSETPVESNTAGVTAPPESAKSERAPTVKRSSDGRCEPTPKQGQPCRAGDGYCVLSWGEPGGHSSALWCRDGRWTIEEEVNL